jgi:hypothetical protein
MVLSVNYEALLRVQLSTKNSNFSGIINYQSNIYQSNINSTRSHIPIHPGINPTNSNA